MSDSEVIEYIKKNFVYHDDGTFERKDRAGSNGSLDKDGYVIIKIKGKQYKAHRLVYAYFNGKFPEQEIDHINRIRSDNRIENLRDASRAENISNRTPVVNKDTGLVGVHFDRTNGLKRNFAFSKNGRTYRFRTALEAKTARERMLANEHL